MTNIPKQLACSNLSRKQYKSITSSIEYYMSLPDDFDANKREATICVNLINSLSMLSLITPAEYKALMDWILDLGVENNERIMRNNQ